jgi:hypothetical protein
MNEKHKIIDLLTPRKEELLKKIHKALVNASGPNIKNDVISAITDRSLTKKLDPDSIVNFKSDMNDGLDEVGLELNEIHLYPWLIEQVSKHMFDDKRVEEETALSNAQHEFEHLFHALDLIRGGTLKARLVLKLFKKPHRYIPNAYNISFKPFVKFNGPVKYRDYLKIINGPSILSQTDKIRVGKN